ncbi:MAG: glutamyl-tRNA reductase, partial [Deltaproteobacteria bacterium]
KERSKEAKDAERIIAEEITNFYRWIKSLDVVPTIIALRKFCEEIRKQELAKAMNTLGNLSEKDRAAIEAMSSAIVNKILHNPMTHLKKDSDKIEGDRYVDTVRKLFDIEDAVKEKETMKKANRDGE